MTLRIKFMWTFYTIDFFLAINIWQENTTGNEIAEGETKNSTAKKSKCEV